MLTRMNPVNPNGKFRFARISTLSAALFIAFHAWAADTLPGLKPEMSEEKFLKLSPASTTYLEIQTGVGQAAGGGFVKYAGRNGGRMVIVLSADTGSAFPSEDLRVYALLDVGWHLIWRTGTHEQTRFSCAARGDKLAIYQTTATDTQPKPFEILDLNALIAGVAKK